MLKIFDHFALLNLLSELDMKSQPVFKVYEVHDWSCQPFFGRPSAEGPQAASGAFNKTIKTNHVEDRLRRAAVHAKMIIARGWDFGLFLFTETEFV